MKGDMESVFRASQSGSGECSVHIFKVNRLHVSNC